MCIIQVRGFISQGYLQHFISSDLACITFEVKGNEDKMSQITMAAAPSCLHELHQAG